MYWVSRKPFRVGNQKKLELMKKLKSKLIIVFLVSVLFGCKKNVIENQNDLTLKKKVYEWLDKQQTPLQTQHIEAVKKLKENIEIGSSWEEKYEKEESILIIPINKNYVLINSRNKNPDNLLVLFQDKQNNIRSGYIIQHLKNKENTFTKKSIANIYNHIDKDLDGTFKVLTIHDMYIFETLFENNKAKTTKSRTSKDSNNTPQSTSTSGCLDWYWVITDMNTGQTTYTYLYTTCNNGCVYNDPNNESIENCESGSGGDVPNNTVVEKDVSWTVGANPAGAWTVTAEEHLKGLKTPQEPPNYTKGHFTSFTHNGDGITTVPSCADPRGYPYPNLPWANWIKFSCGNSISNASNIATVSIMGNVTFCDGGLPTGVSNVKAWIFWVEFP